MDRLKLSLGSPVNIKFRAGKKVQGKIEIAFSSEAELERLIAFLWMVKIIQTILKQ